MERIESMMFSSAGLAHSITFKELNPYQVDTLCETIFSEYERLIFDLPINTKANSVKVLEFKHVIICGMRKFHMSQMYAQKASYDNYCEQQSLSEGMPRELTRQQQGRQRKKYKQFFDTWPLNKQHASKNG